jgi:ribosomal-protein-alanine N-acetyltransferase
MTVSIRNTESGDVDCILELEQQNFSFPHTREQLEYEIHDQVYSLLTATENDAVLGYAGLMHAADEGYITNVVVSKEFRRCGIADLLLESIEQEASKLNLSFISLEVRESNYPAIKLYLKNGYIKKAVLPMYYQKPKEDGIIMTKYLLKENKVENSGV